MSDARVLGAMKRLNYEPDAIARQFVEHCSGTARPPGRPRGSWHRLALGHRPISYVSCGANDRELIGPLSHPIGHTSRCAPGRYSYIRLAGRAASGSTQSD